MARLTKANLKIALEAKAGIMSAAAEVLGVTRQAVWAAVQKDPELKALCEVQIAKVNDIAKARIVTLIQNGDARATMWWLEHRDPEFAPKRHVSGPGGGPMQVNLAELFDGLSESELAAIVAIRRRAREGEAPPG